MSQAAISQDQQEATYRQLEIFANVLSILQENYIDEIDADNTIEGAISGMLLSLDPHSSYLTAEDFDEKVIKEYLEVIQLRESVDFGELCEDLQMQVIRAVKASSGDRDTLMELNPFLNEGCTAGDWNDLITYNREIIARDYSVQRNRERLLKMYKEVSEFTPKPRIRGDVLLHIFNTPGASHLLLCDQSYDE